MKFDMSISDNYASFVDDDGVALFVDSFDNEEFEVRIGTIAESKEVGRVIASSDEELNQKLEVLFKLFKDAK